jgi:hypothetical protein
MQFTLKRKSTNIKMPHPTQYIHMDSTYRDRRQYPSIGNFVIKCESGNSLGASSGSNLAARDPITIGSIYQNLKWVSNSFNAFATDAPIDSGKFSAPNNATLNVFVTENNNYLAMSTDLIIVGSVQSPTAEPAIFLQPISDYYKGAMLNFPAVGAVPAMSARILHYTFLGDNQGEFIVGPGFSEIPTSLRVCSITDPTDIPNEEIFVPTGSDAKDAYGSALGGRGSSKNFIIFNDTQNSWRPIHTYTRETKILSPYTGPPLSNLNQSTGDASTWGTIQGWSVTDSYSIRIKYPPMYKYPVSLPKYVTTAPFITQNSNLWYEMTPIAAANPVSSTDLFNLGVNVGYLRNRMLGSYLEVSPYPIEFSPPPVATVGKAVYYGEIAPGSTLSNLILDYSAILMLPVANMVALKLLEIPNFFRGFFIRMTKGPGASFGAAEGEIRTMTANTSIDAAGLVSVTVNPPLYVAPVVGDTFAIGFTRNIGELGGTAVPLPWSTEPYHQSRQIIDYINAGGDIQAASISDTSLIVSFSCTCNVATDAYKNFWVNWAHNITVPPAADFKPRSRLIAGSTYDSTTKLTTFTFVRPLTEAILNTNWQINGGRVAGSFISPLNVQRYWIQQYDRDNAQPFQGVGSAVALQGQVCYEVSLVSVILPNSVISGGNGGQIAFYPYVMVGLRSAGSAGGAMPNIIQSNNPYTWDMLFICNIDDVHNPQEVPFIKIDANGMSQTIKFNPRSNLELTIRLPSGELFDVDVMKTLPPYPPNPLGQLSAIFSFTRL